MHLWPWARVRKVIKPGLKKNGFNCHFFSNEKKRREEPVAQRHQMVSNSLALLLFIGPDLHLRSRAAAPIGDEVL